MSNEIPETITDPEVFLAEIEKDIPDTTILETPDEPTVIDPIQMTPIVGYGTPVNSVVSYNQKANTSLSESASSKKLSRSVQTTVEHEAVSTQLESGGDSIQTVKVRPSLSFSISIPISLQV